MLATIRDVAIIAALAGMWAMLLMQDCRIERGVPIAASICPAVGAVVRPEGTPEEVCGKIPPNVSGHEHDSEVAARCWQVVTTAWEQYYLCGRSRLPLQDGGLLR